jgi:hypothetical protein
MLDQSHKLGQDDLDENDIMAFAQDMSDKALEYKTLSQ